MNIERSVITVGPNGGRGFVVEGWPDRYVITAAHCLPALPPAHAMSYVSERTYGELLGPLGEKPTIMAECAFADPVSDIAVLSEPDGQVWDEAEAY